jgi:hypothetical protein
MAHANIHIRKSNEARWNAITKKSAWVNAMLEKSPPNSKVIEQKLEPEPKAVHTFVPEQKPPIGAPFAFGTPPPTAPVPPNPTLVDQNGKRYTKRKLRRREDLI